MGEPSFGLGKKDLMKKEKKRETWLKEEMEKKVLDVQFSLFLVSR